MRQRSGQRGKPGAVPTYTTVVARVGPWARVAALLDGSPDQQREAMTCEHMSMLHKPAVWIPRANGLIIIVYYIREAVARVARAWRVPPWHRQSERPWPAEERHRKGRRAWRLKHRGPRRA